MIQKLIQTSYFYTLSVGLHIAILFSLLLTVNIKPPVIPPVISASVYFETPKKVVIKKKILKKTTVIPKKQKKIKPVAKKKIETKPAAKKKIETKPVAKKKIETKSVAKKKIETKSIAEKKIKAKTLPPIVKPKLKAINSQNYPTDNNTSENLNLTAENPINLKGFLRANQLTQKPKSAQSTNLTGNSNTLISKSTKITQKYKANLLAKNSNSQTPLQQKPTEKPTEKSTEKSTKKSIVEQSIESNQYDDLLAEYDDVEEHENTTLATKWSKRTEKKVFQKSLFFQISEHWILPPIAISDFQVVVSVLMNNEGEIKKINFIEYAPIAIINIAVERTLRNAEPFENVPDSMLQPNGEYKTIFKFTASQVAN